MVTLCVMVDTLSSWLCALEHADGVSCLPVAAYTGGGAGNSADLGWAFKHVYPLIISDSYSSITFLPLNMDDERITYHYSFLKTEGIGMAWRRVDGRRLWTCTRVQAAAFPNHPCTHNHGGWMLLCDTG